MSSIVDATAAAVAKTLLPSTPSLLVGRRVGVIIAANAGPPPSVDVALGTTTLPAVRYRGPFQPQPGETVFVEFAGPDPLVTGKSDDGGSYVAPGAVSFSGELTLAGNRLQFPSVLSDNKINLYSDTFSIGVRSHSMVFRSGATGTDLFRFEQNNGTFLASIFNSVGGGGGLAKIGIAYVGNHPVHGPSWAGFGHWDRQGTSEYQFLANANGEVLINAAGTSPQVRIFVNAAQRIAITNTSVIFSNVPVTMDGGNLNITGNSALFFNTHGGGWYMQDASWVRSVSNKGIHTGGTVGAGDARMANFGSDGSWANFHHAAQPNSGVTYGLMIRNNGHVLLNSVNNPVEIRQNGAAAADFRVRSMPELGGGQNVWIVTASWQLGRQPSHFHSKRGLRDVTWGDDNPLWGWKVHRFHWNEERVGNAAETNARVPDGFTGLVAEEVHATAPDAVVPGPDGEPTGFDALVLLGYAVDALQSCHRRLKAIEAIPAVATALNK